MKNTANIILAVFFMVILSCQDYYNPYDRECPPEIWTPTNLKAVLKQGKIELTWKQKETHFDGYQLEMSTDSLTWEEVNSSLIPPVDTSYSDPGIIPGDTMYYRIYGIADLNTSDNAYSNRVIVRNVPQVVTLCPSSISETTVTLNDSVPANQDPPVIETGFYYSTKPITDISKCTKVIAPKTSGKISVPISGLTKGQTYYVKAFATSNVGIGLGNELSFATTYFGSSEETEFKKYMPIYTGTSQLDVSGVYKVSLFTVVNDSRTGSSAYKPGDKEPDLVMRFRKNITCVISYDFDSYQNFTGKSSEMTSASNTTFMGSGNNFTCHFVEDGMTFGIVTKKIIVISATKTTSGLKDCFVGIKIISKESDPQSLVYPAGTYVIFKDGDSLSEYSSWNPL